MNHNFRKFAATGLIATFVINGVLAALAHDQAHCASKPHHHHVANHQHSTSHHICDPHDHEHTHPGQPRPCNDKDPCPACQYVAQKVLVLEAPHAAEVGQLVDNLADPQPSFSRLQAASVYQTRAPPAIA